MIGKPFHVVGSGLVLTRRGGRLVAVRDGEVAASAPLALVGEVILSGRVGVTTAAMHSMLAHDVPLVLLTESGRALGRLEPPGAAHVQARMRQLDLHRDPGTRLRLARDMVRGKIHNQAVLLRRRARGCADPDAVWRAVSRLAELEVAAGAAMTVGSLLGVEGAAAGAYFGALRTAVLAGHGFRRRERTDRDLVNVLVNYCSALLREAVIAAVVAAGLDPCVSFLHTPARGRPTLAFDLMEEWRPVLLESTVLALVGLRAVTEADLIADPDGAPPRLSASATAAAVRRFQARAGAPARGWPAPSAGTTYREQLHSQARHLRAVLLGDAPTYRAFRWR